MLGYCSKCREYRSDDGSDAWGFYWKDGLPICRRCGHLVELFNHEDKRPASEEQSKIVSASLRREMKKREDGSGKEGKEREKRITATSAHSLET